MLRVTVIIFALLLVGCDEEPGGPGADVGPARDTTASDRAVIDAAAPVDQMPPPPDALRDQFVLQPDTTKSCGSCTKDQVCVYFVNNKTCQVTKAQCKHRGAQCYSTLVNPCSKCETEVCGLWYTAKAPATCSLQVDGGLFPGFYCYCYAK